MEAKPSFYVELYLHSVSFNNPDWRLSGLTASRLFLQKDAAGLKINGVYIKCFISTRVGEGGKGWTWDELVPKRIERGWLMFAVKPAYDWLVH